MSGDIYEDGDPLDYVSVPPKITKTLHCFEWQPIDTAPTNRRIIVSESGPPPRDELTIAWLDRIDGRFYYTPHGGVLEWKPTHWMPIPDTPKDKRTARE